MKSLLVPPSAPPSFQHCMSDVQYNHTLSFDHNKLIVQSSNPQSVVNDVNLFSI